MKRYNKKKNLEGKNLIIHRSNCQTLMHPGRSDLCDMPLTVIRISYFCRDEIFQIRQLKHFSSFLLFTSSKLRQRSLHCPILLPRINSLSIHIYHNESKHDDILLNYGGAKRLKQRFSLLLYHRLRLCG